MHPDALGALLEDHNPWWSGSEARRAVPSVRRDLHGRLLKHVGNESERRALLILGPRQVGKTTLLLQLAEDLLKAGWPPGNLSYFSFDDDRLTELVSAREIVDFAPVGISPQQPRLFLLDEISRAVNWAAWLKQEVDRGHYRLIATDSAASLLRAAGAESGQGRWDEVVLEGAHFRGVSAAAGVSRRVAAGFAQADSQRGRALSTGRRIPRARTSRRLPTGARAAAS